MSRLVEDAACPSPFAQKVRKKAQFRPVADVVEMGDAFLVLIELPGLGRGDVTLEAHGNELAVFGDRNPPQDFSGGAFHVMERSYGCFARRFTLPLEIDPATVHASMKSGLLTVTVSKRPQNVQNKRITLSTDNE